MLLQLPPELLEEVLLVLPLRDVIHLTIVNSYLRDLITNSHHIWTHHLIRYQLYLKESDPDPEKQWWCDQATFRRRWCFLAELYRSCEELSLAQLHNPVIEIDPEGELIQGLISTPERLELSIGLECLHQLVHNSEPGPSVNLTNRFYVEYLQVTARQSLITAQVTHTLSDQQDTPSSLFAGCLLVSHWISACLGLFSSLQVSVHDRTVRGRFPAIATLNTMVETCRGMLADPSIEGVLGVITTVLFDQYKLEKAEQDEYYDFNNNRVDNVLATRRGIPITIAVIYYEVARLLGVPLNLVNFPRHFLLSYTGSDGVVQYIDCYNRGHILTRTQCLQLCPVTSILDNDSYFSPVDTATVLTRLVRNTIFFRNLTGSQQSAHKQYFTVNMLRLMSYIQPGDDDIANQAMVASLELRTKFEFLRNFAMFSSNSDKWLEYNKIITEEMGRFKEREEIKTVKPPEVQFEIGRIMFHKLYNYTCVLYGWDTKCMMSYRWQEQMGISALKFQGTQPYYRVLADDRSVRYVAQENLEYMSEHPHYVWSEQHPDIGKYFKYCEWDEMGRATSYVPNDALKSIYTYLNVGCHEPPNMNTG